MSLFTTRVCLATLILPFVTACALHVSEDEMLASAYERVERNEAIREFVRSCEALGAVVIYTGPSYPKLYDPTKRIPSHARPSHYQCTRIRY